MAGEGFDLTNQRSRRLPPAEAWNDPDQWFDIHTGLAHPRTEKMPMIYTDGFVDIDALVDNAQATLFRPDYEWKFNARDYQTKPDNHHFYFTAREYSPLFNNGNTIPSEFRELPVNMGRIPRQFHNVLHDFYEQPVMPPMEQMHDYITSYQLAHTAFKRLYLSAQQTLQAMALFPQRRELVASHGISPKFDDDRIGEEVLRRTFGKHFSSYNRALEHYYETEGKEIIYKDHESIKVTRPQVVVRKMGSIVNRRSVTLAIGNQAA